jgi:hypothetical protein
MSDCGLMGNGITFIFLYASYEEIFYFLLDPLCGSPGRVLYQGMSLIKMQATYVSGEQ